MDIKRILLLAIMALAAIAFAAPAIAQASEHDEWWTVTTNEAGEVEGEHTLGKTTETGKTVEFTGNITTTSATGLRMGPCEYHVGIWAWNHEPKAGTVTATADVYKVEITTPCPTNVENCNVDEATSKAFPWHVDIAANTAIDVTGANFLTKFAGGGCAGAGVPAAFEATGTLTGQGSNGASQFCITFNNAPHMTIHPIPTINIPVTLDGAVCAPDLTLTTAES